MKRLFTLYFCFAIGCQANESISYANSGGCANSANQTTRNFPAINEYIKKRMSLFHDMRLHELRMDAVPSPEGGEIVVSGYINSQKDYDLLVQLFSSPTLNPTPAKLVWKVTVDPIRAPNHNVY